MQRFLFNPMFWEYINNRDVTVLSISWYHSSMTQHMDLLARYYCIVRFWYCYTTKKIFFDNYLIMNQFESAADKQNDILFGI